jgi:hypothetical protein
MRQATPHTPWGGVQDAGLKHTTGLQSARKMPILAAAPENI